MASKRLTVDISHRTIIFTTFFLLALKFLSNIIDIIIGLFIAFLIVLAVSPIVDSLEKRRIPRALSSLLILFTLLIAFGGLIASIVTPLLTQTQVLIQRLPELVEKLAPYYNLDLETALPQFSALPGNFLRIALGTFSGFVTLLTMIVISFYLLLDKPRFKSHLTYLFGNKGDTYYHIFQELERKLGLWIRGMLFLMLIVGLLSYTGFLLIGLPFAVPLAVIAGILELVPNIGPTVAAIPAIIVGFSVSTVHGLLAIAVSIIVQQLENNLLVPKVMQRAIGIHPLITIIALLIGYQLGGALLAVLSLPIVISIEVIFSHLHLNGKTHSPEIS